MTLNRLNFAADTLGCVVLWPRSVIDKRCPAHAWMPGNATWRPKLTQGICGAESNTSLRICANCGATLAALKSLPLHKRRGKCELEPIFLQLLWQPHLLPLHSLHPH